MSSSTSLAGRPGVGTAERARRPGSRRAGRPRDRWLPLVLGLGLAGATLGACSSGSGTATSGSTATASSAYCAQARVVAGEARALASDPSKLKSDFESFYALEPLAPSAIRADVKTVADYYRKVANQLPDNPTKTQISDALNSVAASPGQEGVPQATSNVTSYTQRACGVNLSPG